MKRLFYGVAVSALLIGAGGAAMACEKLGASAALENPAAASQAANPRGFVLAQAQQDEEKSTTTGEESKEKSEALPHKAIGPLAQSQDDADKEKAEDGKESKPEAMPSRERGFVMAQAQQEEQSGTTGEDSEEKSEDSK